MTITKSARFFGGESQDGLAQGPWAVMKHWVDKSSFNAGLLFRGTCHGPSGGVLIGGPVSCPAGGPCGVVGREG